MELLQVIGGLAIAYIACVVVSMAVMALPVFFETARLAVMKVQDRGEARRYRRVGGA